MANLNDDNNFFGPLPQQNPQTPPFATPIGGAYSHACPPAPEKTPNKMRAIEVCLVAISLAIFTIILVAIIAVFGFLGTVTSFSSPPVPKTNPPKNSFSVLRVEGAIQSSSGYSSTEAGYNHNETISHVKSLIEDENNKGILLYMNTGGGGVFESDELFRELEVYKEKTKRPIWVYMHKTCASGGYYISMAADKIFANPGATTGSIGVYISFTDTSGLYEKLGIESVLIRSGENKGAGVPGSPINEKQREVYQSIIDEEYLRFVSLVAKGRSMPEAEVKKLADGRPFTANQALKSNLVDEISNWDATLEAFEAQTKAKAFCPNFTTRSPLSQIISQAEDALPKNDLNTALDLAYEVPNGVPMAWAPAL